MESNLLVDLKKTIYIFYDANSIFKTKILILNQLKLNGNINNDCDIDCDWFAFSYIEVQ